MIVYYETLQDCKEIGIMIMLAKLESDYKNERSRDGLISGKPPAWKGEWTCIASDNIYLMATVEFAKWLARGRLSRRSPERA